MRNEMTTWEAYRHAGRNLRWPVYRFFRLVWIAAVVYLFAAMTFPSAIGSGFADLAMAAAIIAAIAHSGSQNLTMPWLTLRAILLGVLVYGVCVLIERYTSIDLREAWVAVIAGTAQLLKDSDRATRDLVRMKMSDPDP